jgi:hypothetical protein
MRIPRRAISPATLAAVMVCLSVLTARAQTTAPAAAPATTEPALGQLDHATQELYRATQSHLVRVLVPIRILSDHPLLKWQSQLDPKLRDQLAASMARGQSSPGLYVHAGPDARIPIPGPTAVVHIECAGVVLSPRGDVLLPMYINPAEVNELPVSLGEEKGGGGTTGQVRATDRLTGLTIVRLAQPAGTPGKFAKATPATGSVVLMIAATRRGAQLAVWTGDQPPKDSGVIIDSAGEVAAIVRNGHPFYAPAFAPVVEQLLSSGEVRRPELGMRIGEVQVDDHSAARVTEVLADSAAAAGGVRPYDLIVSLAGQPVADIPTFAAALANRSGRTELRVLRDGREQTLTVDLQPR